MVKEYKYFSNFYTLNTGLRVQNLSFFFLLISAQFCGTSPSEPPFLIFYFGYVTSSAITKMCLKVFEGSVGI
jgi:hypothetical protein